MSTETKIALADLNKLTPMQIADNPQIQNKFVKLYNSIHGSDNGELILEREKYHFVRQINDNPGLKQCTSLSLYGCFMDVAVTGMTFEGGSQPLIYMIPRSVNVGTKEQKQYEKRAVLMISPYGELVLRMKAGQIRHADNPVIVYEGDSFQYGSDRDGNWVKHTAKVPNESQKIIACYMRIVRNDGTVDFSYLLEADVKRLAGYSEKQNFGKANALYASNGGQIDTGFLKAKTIKHAFKTYPKLVTSKQMPMGEHTVVESQDEVETPAIDYGIEPEPESFDEAEVVAEQAVVVEEDQNDQEGGF